MKIDASGNVVTTPSQQWPPSGGRDKDVLTWTAGQPTWLPEAEVPLLIRSEAASSGHVTPVFGMSGYRMIEMNVMCTGAWAFQANSRWSFDGTFVQSREVTVPYTGDWNHSAAAGTFQEITNTTQTQWQTLPYMSTAEIIMYKYPDGKWRGGLKSQQAAWYGSAQFQIEPGCSEVRFRTFDSNWMTILMTGLR